MSPEIAYFLKVNVAFMLFYAFYRLSFYKDTFFKLRRFILLVFFLLALVYPLLNFQEWVKGQEPIAEVILLYTAILPETMIASEPVQTMDWQGLFRILLSGVYWSAIALLMIRFFIQLGSIIWLALKSKQTIIHGTKVHVLDKPSGPFSFFKLIFLYPNSHSDKETEEVLAHERTHASQWHSIDVIVSELICAFCWMNPFVWLLKREVRHNLEYLADNTVLQSGYDSKSYQYHLLGLAHHSKSAGNIYNSFNVLHLKNRITMMNKKRTHAIGRTKYLAFIPLAALLMLLSNMEAVARITKDMATTIKEEQMMPKEPVMPMEEQEAPIEEPAAKEEAPVVLEPEETEQQIQHTIFTVVEEMPKFPGGEGELLKFLGKNIKYPVIAQENGVQGRVICSFVINTDGSIVDAEVTRGVDPSLDKEAIRVLHLMPKWEPGKQRGKAVRVKYTVPVTFRLQGEENEDQVFTVVEQMPSFPGGEHELLKFLGKNIKYPVIAQENGIQGRVICSFVINRDGSIVDAEVTRGVDPSLDKEAIRVLHLMPKWEPGKQRGKAVRVKYTVPITFRLQ